MTRLDQALRWWSNHDEGPIPLRHLNVMFDARYVRIVNDDDGEHCDLTRAGKAAKKYAEVIRQGDA